MIDLYKTPDDQLAYTVRSLKRIMQERGWPSLHKIYDGLNFLVATRPDGQTLRFFSACPPTTSSFAAAVADNKALTYQLLKDLPGVQQPDTIILGQDLSPVADFLARHPQVVVKPVDSAHGNGISVGLTSEPEVRAAIQRASQFCHLPGIILQEQLVKTTDELRVIVINYQFTIALARIPATVTGDGTHTLAQLIELENTNLRTPPYQSDLAYIDQPAALQFLGDRAQQEIPAPGERVQVLSICNVGRGGTAQDVSNTIPQSIKDAAVAIAKATELPVVGVDFFGDYVLELNRNPSLYYPTGDASADLAARAYVDYLEGL